MSLLNEAGRLAALAMLALAPSYATAHDVTAGTLLIQQPWARATPGGAEVAGGYVTIINNGTAPDRLVGGSIAAATTFELHRMSTENGVMRMRPTGPLEIPAGGRLTLDPSATHIMFTGLKRSFKKGETIDGTLVFDHAGTVPLRFDVEGIGAKSPAKSPAKDDASGHAGRSMPGMDMD